MISMIVVFKCIHGLSPSMFNNKFTSLSYQKNTRGNGLNLSIQKSKAEPGKKTFPQQGALTCNKLPRELKDEVSLLFFKSKLKLLNF